MSKCHNPNTSEYKSLLNRFKSPFTVDMAINEWQSLTNDDSIPTVDDVQSMKDGQKALFSLKKENFSDSVLLDEGGTMRWSLMLTLKFDEDSE